MAGLEKVPIRPNSPLSNSHRPENPERRLTILLISTAIIFAFIGSTLGAFALAHISGVPTDLGLGFFPAHPYLQIYGFIAEFIVGVAYSLLPRFKAAHVSNIGLGYFVYVLLTSGNALFLSSPVLTSYTQIAETLAPLLILISSVIFVYQVNSLASRPIGGFPETNLLMRLSSVSLVLISASLVLDQTSLLNADPFSPEMIFLSLIGFAGSMIYAVEIRSVSFRQCNYRKGLAQACGLLQTAAIAITFLAILSPALAWAGAVLFLGAALAAVLSTRIFELAHPLRYRPAMTKMHFTIVRYNEACILSGSVWLLFGCAVGIAMTMLDTNGFFIRDSFIHSIGIGFVGSTITCFAPMLLPGLLGKKAPASGLSFWPILLLDTGILVRVAGDFETLIVPNPPIWESLSGPLILAAMISLLIMLARIGKHHQVKRISDVVPRVSDLESVKDARDAIITVLGRKTNREIPVSIWFATKGDAIYLLPIQGTATEWYRNIRAHPDVKIRIEDRTFSGKTKSILDSGQVRNAIKAFKDKYGDRVYRNTYDDHVNCAVVVTPYSNTSQLVDSKRAT